MYYMERDMTEVVRTVTRTAEVLKDYEVLRAQFNNVLDLLLPGDGNDLLPLHGQDWPALKDQVTGWMAEQLQGLVYGRRLRQTIESGAGVIQLQGLAYVSGTYGYPGFARRAGIGDQSDGVGANSRRVSPGHVPLDSSYRW